MSIKYTDGWISFACTKMGNIWGCKSEKEYLTNQIYLVTLRPRQLTQASFLQKNQMLQMFFDIFTPEIPVSSKI